MTARSGPACGRTDWRDWLLWLAVWPLTLLIVAAITTPPIDPEDRG